MVMIIMIYFTYYLNMFKLKGYLPIIANVEGSAQDSEILWNEINDERQIRS